MLEDGITQNVAAIHPLRGQRIVNKDVLSIKRLDSNTLTTIYNSLIGTMHDYDMCMESADFSEIDSYYNPGIEEVDKSFILESIVIKKFSRTEHRMNAVVRALNKHLTGDITALPAIVGTPKRTSGFAYVTVQLPFSDGQTVSVIFHAPEGDQKKIMPDDTIAAFRWLLNKRDITQVVSKEDGAEVPLETLCMRIGQLVEKNSIRFSNAQKQAVEEKKELIDVGNSLDDAKKKEKLLMDNIELKKKEESDINSELSNSFSLLDRQKGINLELEKRLADLQKAVKQDKLNRIAIQNETIASQKAEIESLRKQIEEHKSKEPLRGNDNGGNERTREGGLPRDNSGGYTAGQAIRSSGGQDNGSPILEPNSADNGRTGRIIGRTARLTLPSGKKLPAHYEIVDADTIQASHDPFNDFTPNKNYGLVNERQYNKEEASKKAVRENASNLDPDLIATPSPDANQGAPVVDKNGNVLGGNSRTMSIKLALDRFPVKAEQYKEALIENADMFGIDPKLIKKIKQPILIRRIDEDKTQEEAQALISDLNGSFTKAKTKRSGAFSNAQRFSKGTVKSFVNGMKQTKSETLREFFNSQHSKSVIEMLIADGVISETDRNMFVDSKGLLTPEGKTHVEAAFCARFFPSYEVNRAMPAKQLEFIQGAIPQLLDIDQCDDPKWNITKDIKDATKLYAQYYNSEAFKDQPYAFLNQLDMEGKSIAERYSKKTLEIFNAFANDKKKEFAKRLEMYADDSHTSGGLPGTEKSPNKSFFTAFTKDFSIKDEEEKEEGKKKKPDKGEMLF